MAKKVSEREGRLRQISFRTTDEMSQRLLKSASLLGRSLTQEIERRLEVSLAQEDYVRQNWGDDVFRIAEAIARSLAHIEYVEGKRWPSLKSCGEH